MIPNSALGLYRRQLRTEKTDNVTFLNNYNRDTAESFTHTVLRQKPVQEPTEDIQRVDLNITRQTPIFNPCVNFSSQEMYDEYVFRLQNQQRYENQRHHLDVMNRTMDNDTLLGFMKD